MISTTISQLTKPVLFAAMACWMPAAVFSSDAPVYSHHGKTGASSFAVGLKTDQAGPQVTRHLILVDTSASQMGNHRRQAHAVLDAVLQHLPADHQVCLLAVDVDATPLMESFAAPQSAEVKQALQKLARRAPLGATDLAAGLTAAIDRCESGTTTSVLYIGDGMSTAHLLTLDTLELLTSNLRTVNAQIHSYAVGPQKDTNLLGILAQQTGGCVIVDTAETTTEEVASRLVSAIGESAQSLQSLELGAEVKLTSDRLLPLRSDRTLYLIGQGTFRSGDSIRAQVGGKQIVWQAQPKKAGNQVFLGAVTRGVTESRGLFAGYPSEELLLSASLDFQSQLDDLRELAQKSLSYNKFDQARELANAIKQLDPENEQAVALLGAADEKQQLIARVQFEQPAPPQSTPKAGDEDLDLIDREIQLRTIRTEQLTLEVNNLIKDAQKLAETNPSNALNELKAALGTVTAAVDIDPEAQRQLTGRLRSTILDVQARKETREQQESFRQQQLVEREAVRRIRAELELDEEKFQMLLERVRSLMAEGYREFDDTSFEAAEAVAEEAVRLRPESGTANSAFFKAEAAGQLSKAFKLKFIRRDAFLAVLHDVEAANTPIPDEPPVRWPSAEVWQDLTERRKIWKRTNLRKNSPTEEAIIKALDEPYQAEFFQMPLREVILDIAANKRIPIIFDPEEVGDVIDPDVPIDLQLSGVTLRTILKFILEPNDLVYIIDDEVLKIMSYEKSLTEYFVYVYPVGDLVITPIQLQQAASSSGFGGGGNAFGGQGGQLGGGIGGQQGGGGGGFGGGGGGQGFGGGGGNFFSVRPFGLQNNAAPAPRRAVPRQQNNNRQLPPNVHNNPEADNLLQQILKKEQSSIVRPSGMFQAQITDDAAPRLNNATLLKKKL